MKKILLSFFTFFSIYNYSQGCVDKVVCSDDTITIFLLDGTTLTWGKNQYGQLGNNTTTLQSSPIPTINGSDWADINHARMHTVAIHQNGTLWTWGNNAVGQLGNGTTTDSYVPVQVGTDSDWSVISPGNLHTVALKSNGTLWGWGNNGAYELKNGGSNVVTSPVQLSPDTDWNKIYGGYFKTFAIKNNGTLWGIGRNNSGDLGVGSTITVYNITQIGTDSDWQKISAARDRYTLALKTNGTLWAWGNNENGRLGDGTTINRTGPVQIGNSTWKDIAAGNFHAIGIKSDGTLWQWGSYGWINGSIMIPISHAPVQVGTDTNWKSVSAGYSSSYAVKEDNTLYAWGYSGGYLGDGTATSYANPILFPCSTLSAESFENTAISFYPNPVKDELNILNSTEIEKFEIFNVIGQNVMQGSIQNDKINLTQLSEGMYICHFYKNNGQSITHKFIKE
ncbi:RCC1 domain-containing protein [Flavobacterium channae]|uniref:RCC1 domain-containing protein n=1 Tax=Flavobacterium channae TaxID=2897181 RepID=UPI001E3BC3BC|nr:T9SS type A sorting domain-containing protein [Flavobacterium channae]UGS22934.1 T9SS type A sorting domain-containing protein [Flavobacterium channae]